jgi:hypothetical protein
MLPWSVACEANWLGKEQSILIAWEKSAEGIVAGKRTFERSCGIIDGRDKAKARTV